MTRMEVGTSTPKGRRMRPSRCKNHKLSWFDRLSSLAPHNYVLLYSLFHLWRDMPSRICIAFGSVSQISMALLRQARGQKFLAARWIATSAPVFLLVPISKATGHSRYSGHRFPYASCQLLNPKNRRSNWQRPTLSDELVRYIENSHRRMAA